MYLAKKIASKTRFIIQFSDILGKLFTIIRDIIRLIYCSFVRPSVWKHRNKTVHIIYLQNFKTKKVNENISHMIH